MDSQSLLAAIDKGAGGLLKVIQGLTQANITYDPQLEGDAGVPATEAARALAQRVALSRYQQAAAQRVPWYAMGNERDLAGQQAYTQAITAAAAAGQERQATQRAQDRHDRLVGLIKRGSEMTPGGPKPMWTKDQASILAAMPEEQLSKVLAAQMFPSPGADVVPVGYGASWVRDPDTGKMVYHPGPPISAIMGGGGAGGAPADPAQTDALVDAIGTYRNAPPTGRQAYSPQGRALLAAVLAKYPNYDATQYKTKSEARSRFASGPQGNSVRSFNTAIDHLSTLQDLANELHNGNVQMVNLIANTISSQLGVPAPTNFDTAKKIVADEVTKAIVGGQMAQADREETVSNIRNAKSPAQLAGAINAFMRLMGGQLNSLRRQYRASTGLDDFESYLTPDAIPFLHDDAPTQSRAAPASLPPNVKVTRSPR